MSVNKRAGIFSTIALVITAVFAAPSSAQDEFDVFASANAENTQRISYSEFDEFLKTFGREEKDRLVIYYRAMKPRGVAYLDSYTDALAKLTPSNFSKDEQLAYWLNLRNILIVRAIGAGSPGHSLKEERGDPSNPGEMWTRKRLSVEGVAMSIDDIEQKIILRNFDNPNLVYGLHQGTKGGPVLSMKTFTGLSVNDALQSLGADFVNARRSVSVKSDTVKAPAIYSWYKEALFDGSDAAVIDHLRGLAEPKLHEKLASATKLAPKKFSYSIDVFEVRQSPQVNLRGSSTSGLGSGS